MKGSNSNNKLMNRVTSMKIVMKTKASLEIQLNHKVLI